MISTWLIRALLLEYIIILVVCLFERNYKLALYWFGASILQVSILAMNAK